MSRQRSRAPGRQGSGAGNGMFRRGECCNAGDKDDHRLRFRFRHWGRRAARYAAALEDLDDDHAAAAAGTWRATLGCGAAASAVPLLSCIARRCRLCQRLRGGDQLPGACDVGFAAGAGEQPVMADAVKSLGQDVEQEAPDELVGGERHRAIPRLPVAAVILVAEGDAALVEAQAGGCSRWRRGGYSGRDRRAPPRARRRAAWHRRTSSSAAAARDGRRRPADRAGRRARRRRPAGPPRGRRRARPGRAGGTGARAPAPATESRAGRISSACRPAISRRPARSCEHADGGSLPSPRCGARRWRRSRAPRCLGSAAMVSSVSAAARNSRS